MRRSERPPDEDGHASLALRPLGAGRTRVGEKVYICKRGKGGRYVAEFWHDGEHRRRTLGTADRAIATRRALQLEADLLAGTYDAPKAPVPLAGAVTEYLEVKEGEGRAAKTITKYREWLESFAGFANDKGVTTLQQVTPGLFERYRAFRNPDQSERSMYTGLTIVKSFMKWCAAPGREYLARNPVVACKVPEPYAAPKFSPTRRQVAAILAAATGAARAQYALLAYTGLRAGEMRMLRPRDVDLQRGWVHVVGRPGWVPKTRQARKVPVHPLLMEYLTAYVASLPKSAAEPPSFSRAAPSRKYPLGDRPINLRELNANFQKLAGTLGVRVGRKDDGLVIHSL